VGRVAGKVAFITGAGRGQGRSHALRLAEEGADVIITDIAAPIASVSAYDMSTEEDLAETARQVESLGRRVLAAKIDVRDESALALYLGKAVAELGRLDIVVANAGIFQLSAPLELDESGWQETIDIDLSGVWKTTRAALPHLLSGGRGGSIILTSSVAGMVGMPNAIHYSAAKHGVVGIMKSLASAYAHEWIRVNSIHPGGVNTPMIQNEDSWRFWDPVNVNSSAAANARLEHRGLRAMPIPWVEPVDISNAVLFLASDEARYITGVQLPIDAGVLLA
jgi:(+)-trans-carveol dehydrogenase